MAINVLASEKYSSTSEVDLSQAESFLQLIDPHTTQFCFRTYGDKDKNNPRLRCKLEGSLEQHAETLVAKNKLGASICVVVNDGGHADNQIERIRFVFADTDGVSPNPLARSLEPHAIIVSSNKRYHLYWRVTDLCPAQFSILQKAIAKKYGTDGVVSNPSRIMRIPGFFHQKKEPYLTHIYKIHTDLPAYTADEITSGLKLEIGHVRQAASKLVANSPAPLPLKEVERCLAYLNPYEPYELWFKVVHLLADYYGEDGRDLCVRWSRGDLWRGQADAP